MGELLASLPDEERARHYRMFATAAMQQAGDAVNAEERASYLSMAADWHALALELERAADQDVAPNPH
ncbi:MAG: hypothetical protein ACJ8IR_03220 [Alphaproteobacteria bacterium]